MTQIIFWLKFFVYLETLIVDFVSNCFVMKFIYLSVSQDLRFVIEIIVYDKFIDLNFYFLVLQFTLNFILKDLNFLMVADIMTKLSIIFVRPFGLLFMG